LEIQAKSEVKLAASHKLLEDLLVVQGLSNIMQRFEEEEKHLTILFLTDFIFLVGICDCHVFRLIDLGVDTVQDAADPELLTDAFLGDLSLSADQISKLRE